MQNQDSQAANGKQSVEKGRDQQVNRASSSLGSPAILHYSLNPDTSGKHQSFNESSDTTSGYGCVGTSYSHKDAGTPNVYEGDRRGLSISLPDVACKNVGELKSHV